MLKIIIAGSRDLKNYDFFEKVVVDIISKEQYDRVIPNKEIEIVSGNNSGGADYYGEKFSKEHLNKDATLFPAMWNDMSPPVIVGHNHYGEFNKLAGPNRNQKMADYASPDGICIAFDAEESNPKTGTKIMIKFAKKSGLKTYHIKCTDQDNFKIRVYNGD